MYKVNQVKAEVKATVEEYKAQYEEMLKTRNITAEEATALYNEWSDFVQALFDGACKNEDFVIKYKELPGIVQNFRAIEAMEKTLDMDLVELLPGTHYIVTVPTEDGKCSIISPPGVSPNDNVFVNSFVGTARNYRNAVLIKSKNPGCEVFKYTVK